MSDTNQIQEVLKDRFVPLAEEAFGEDLRGVILYGSGAGGNFVRGISDVNILVILERLDSQTLERFGRRAARLLHRHRIAPLVMTRDEFVSSADVFPMEYLDIRQRHVVLLGRDDTADLELTTRNLRHQIEDGLRGSLSVLRQVLLGARGRPRALRRFLKRWLGAQTAVLRGLLRLKTEEAVPLDMRELLASIGREYGVDTSAFLGLLTLRERGKVRRRSISPRP